MVELQVQFRERSLAGDAFESGAYGQTATHRQIATFFWTNQLRAVSDPVFAKLL